MSVHLIEAESALGLFDPHAYQSFVGENWTAEQLLAHFLKEMQQGRLLLWGTGAPGRWRVEVALRWSDEKGVREVQGGLTATGRQLCFADYLILSRAAEYRNGQLAEELSPDLAIAIKPGNYACRIVQFYDPAKVEADAYAGTHFLVELEPCATLPPPWSAVPWLEE